MIQFTKENYNEYLKSGTPILLMLADPSEPNCIIAQATLERIDQMFGKEFQVAIADITIEKEIEYALNPEEIPAFYFIKEKKVQKTCSGIHTENELLDMTR